MKRLTILVLIVLALSAFQQSSGPFIHPEYSNQSFSPGEEVEYKLNFSFFTVGRGRTIIREGLHNFNNRPSYKIDVFGKTSGMVDWIAKVDDHWGAYIDTSSFLPHQTYRNIKEGRYRKNEIVRFDYDSKMIEVKSLDQKTGKFKKPKYYFSPDKQVFDMLGGMLYFRNIDFSNIQEGDTIALQAFFEDTFYDFSTIYRGKDIVKTKVGKFRALVLSPIMPDNDLFEGEDAIRIWISDDKNQLPLKVEAQMFIGSAGVEIIGFKGLRNPVSSFVLGS